MKYKNINKQYFVLKSDAGLQYVSNGWAGAPNPQSRPQLPHTLSNLCKKYLKTNACFPTFGLLLMD